MLSDFFDTVGTIIGVGGKGGFLDAHGRLPRVDRVLLVDSLGAAAGGLARSEEHTSELQSRLHLVCRLLLEKKKKTKKQHEQLNQQYYGRTRQLQTPHIA